MKELVAEKDRLMTELMHTTQYITELFTALEQVKITESGDQKADILTKIKQLSLSLEESKSNLKKSTKRLNSLHNQNSALSDQVGTLEKLITDMQEQIASKESEISALKQETQQLQNDRDSYKLTAENESLEKNRIENEKNTFYYIIGRTDELETKGIIAEEGTGFLGIGGTYVPAKNLNEQDFIRVDIRSTRSLPIPDKFQIVSSHNSKLLEKNPGNNSMSITDPIRFWTSKFLIIIDKR
jgi:myosin heavy subunit